MNTANVNDPLIVRGAKPTYYVQPGLHSHNTGRRSKPGRGRWFLQNLRKLLLFLGICGIGYYGYALSDQYIYQTYQNWSFDQQIAGRRGVTFADYLREQTPFGFLVGGKSAESIASNTPPPKPATPEIMPPAHGSLLGRVAIARLNLAAMVREGVDAKTLSVAVGHVPSTALPGQPGNFAIAAHRDTLFRALKDIRKNDLITFESPQGTYTYQVVATKIVRPSDVSVLQPDGGGLIPNTDTASTGQSPEKLLTMITCYPFYYVGAAPKRFIVEAKLLSNNSDAIPTVAGAPDISPPAPEVSVSVTHLNERLLSAKHAVLHPVRPVGATQDLRRVSANRPETQVATSRPAKKRGFWHRLLHVS